MRKIILIAALLLIFGGLIAMAQAQRSDDNQTVVYGSAATADGGQDIFIVEQPATAPNPLGNPIVVNPQNADTPTKPEDIKSPDKSDAVVRPKKERPADSQDLGKDFQNTLMEANGRIYDVQSYPEQDLKVMGNPSNPATIYSPDVNN